MFSDMGMEFVKLTFDRRKWKGEIHISLSQSWIDDSCLGDR